MFVFVFRVYQFFFPDIFRRLPLLGLNTECHSNLTLFSPCCTRVRSQTYVCVSSKSQRIHLITCFNSPTCRCPFGSWPGRRHQEHQVVRLCPVGGAQTSQQPDWLLHRWPCGGSQGVVPLQPQTLQAYQVGAWDSKQVSLKDIFQKAAQHDGRT